MPIDRLSYDNIHAILAAWFDRHNYESFPWIISGPEDVEVGVTARLYEAPAGECLCGVALSKHPTPLCTVPFRAVNFTGKLDLRGLLRSDPREACAIDHKSTGRIDAAFLNQFSLDSQLTGYIWLLRQTTQRPVFTAFVNAIELSVLPGLGGTVRKCKTHNVDYDECSPLHANFQVVGPIERTDASIARWRKDAISAAHTYHDLLNRTRLSTIDQGGRFNGGCRWCEFREWCVADRAPNQIDKMFMRTPWSPLEHVYGEKAAAHADPHILFIDNSTLKAVWTCGTQAWMRYGHGYTNSEQRGPLTAGIALHAALECWFKGGTAHAALTVFDALYPKEGE